MAQNNKISLLSYDFTKGRQSELSKELKEISGLAMSADGRLFTHNDEIGKIFQIDLKDGNIVKSFSLGRKMVYDDFEGIAIVDKTFYLVNSSGTIYEFSEGKDDEHVEYKTHSTFLSKQYDVEGLCYDPETNALLLACKGYSGLLNAGSKAIFSFSLTTKKLEKEPRFLLSLKELEQKLGERPFHPSSIEHNPMSGTFYLLDSKNISIAEISSQGKILNTVHLSRSLHRKPEGITFESDGSLIISDEGKKNGTLTIYKLKK